MHPSLFSLYIHVLFWNSWNLSLDAGMRITQQAVAEQDSAQFEDVYKDHALEVRIVPHATS